MLNFVMCLAAGMGATMWRRPELFHVLWKGSSDTEQMDQEIRAWGMRMMACALLYLLYLIVMLIS
ncbi:MAG: hypothetical protein KH028_04320 [Oscillospiraceae bacterium]|jgi:hypothetical protein|nr:hypothetical protein [Oscillospiraceae bacterium]